MRRLLVAGNWKMHGSSDANATLVSGVLEGMASIDGVDVLVVVPACPLDHQTAGLVARVVEAHGIVTVTLSTGRDLSANVKPPRTAFVNFPMGNACGAPFDAAQQRRILQDVLALAPSASAPGTLVDLPYDWPQPFGMYFPMKSREDQLRK